LQRKNEYFGLRILETPGHGQMTILLLGHKCIYGNVANDKGRGCVLQQSPPIIRKQKKEEEEGAAV
jgi:hypothetical protein